MSWVISRLHLILVAIPVSNNYHFSPSSSPPPLPSLSTPPRLPPSSRLAPPSPSTPPCHTPIPALQPPPQDCWEGREGERVELLEAPQLHHLHPAASTSDSVHPSPFSTFSGLVRKGMIQPKKERRRNGQKRTVVFTPLPLLEETVGVSPYRPTSPTRSLTVSCPATPFTPKICCCCTLVMTRLTNYLSCVPLSYLPMHNV